MTRGDARRAAAMVARALKMLDDPDVVAYDREGYAVDVLNSERTRQVLVCRHSELALRPALVVDRSTNEEHPGLRLRIRSTPRGGGPADESITDLFPCDAEDLAFLLATSDPTALGLHLLAVAAASLAAQPRGKDGAVALDRIGLVAASVRRWSESELALMGRTELEELCRREVIELKYEPESDDHMREGVVSGLRLRGLLLETPVNPPAEPDEED